METWIWIVLALAASLAGGLGYLFYRWRVF